MAAEPLTPAAIVGRWVARCAADLPVDIQFGPTGADVESNSGSLACRLANLRAMSDVRWYLDFECQDGSLLQLDIYRKARDEILVARRPLGEACLYQPPVRACVPKG